MSSPMDSIEYTPEPSGISQREHEEVQAALCELGLEFSFQNQEQLRAVQDYLRMQEGKKLKGALWREYLECAVEEYKEEGRRLDEYLSIIGVLPKDLDHKGKSCLKFIAQVAGILGSRGVGEEEILLLWTDLVIQVMEVTETQRKLSFSLEKSRKETKQARVVLSELQTVMKSINGKVDEFEKFKLDNEKFRKHAEADGHHADEESKNNQNILLKAGFKEELIIDDLMKKINELREAKTGVSRGQEQQAAYHDLPLNVEDAERMLKNAREFYEELRAKLDEKMTDIPF